MIKISKILEKCVKIRMNEFLNKNNFFSKHQLHFRISMSNNNARNHTTKLIDNELDSKNKSLVHF